MKTFALIITLIFASCSKQEQIQISKPIEKPISDTTKIVKKMVSFIQSQSKTDSITALKISNRVVKNVGLDKEKISTILGVFRVESRFRHSAHSEKGANGIGQLTEIAVTDFVEKQKLETRPNIMKLDDNIDVSIWVIHFAKDHYTKKKDLRSALAMYNGGLKQLRKYEQGKSICKETRNYIDSVMKYKSDVMSLL
jgi:hypothetical protein